MHETEEKQLNMRLSLTICQTQYERLSNTQSGSNGGDLQASQSQKGPSGLSPQLRSLGPARETTSVQIKWETKCQNFKSAIKTVSAFLTDFIAKLLPLKFYKICEKFSQEKYRFLSQRLLEYHFEILTFMLFFTVHTVFAQCTH